MLRDFWEHVDEVILCDTGSKDETLDLAQKFAAERGEADKLVIGRFEWCDDFAAARNYADSLASGDWLSWSDLDDRLVGGEYLRGCAAAAAEEVQGLQFLWAVGLSDPVGVDDFYTPPAHCRLVRNNGRSRWVGRCGEFKLVPGVQEYVGTRIAYWAHPEWRPGKHERLWWQMIEQDDPLAPRAWMYLAMAAGIDGRASDAIEYVTRFLEQRTPGDDHPLFVTWAQELRASGELPDLPRLMGVTTVSGIGMNALFAGRRTSATAGHWTTRPNERNRRWGTQRRAQASRRRA